MAVEGQSPMIDHAVGTPFEKVRDAPNSQAAELKLTCAPVPESEIVSGVFEQSKEYEPTMYCVTTLQTYKGCPPGKP